MTHATTLPCSTCSGTGTDTHEDRHTDTNRDTCRTCGGTGKIAARTGESPEASFRASPTAQTLTPEGKRLADALVTADVLVEHEGEYESQLMVDHAEINTAASLLGAAPEGEGAGLREAGDPLAQFGHHPDPSTDFCIEVESLQGWSTDMRAGRRSQWPFWGRLSRLLRFIKSPEFAALDEIAQRAKPIVLGLEQSAQERLPEAAPFTPAAPKTPDAATGGSGGDEAAATDGPLFVHDFADPAVSSNPSPGDVTLSCDHPATLTVAVMGNGMTATLEEARANARKLARLWNTDRIAPVGEDETGVREALMTTVDALANMMGFFDSPIFRRKYPPDEYMREAIQSGRDALPMARAALAPQPPKAETPAGAAVGSFAIECHIGRDIVASLYEAAEKLPICSLHSVVTGAIQEIEAMRSAAPAARPGDGVERVRHVKSGIEYEVLGEAEAKLIDAESDRFGNWIGLYEGDKLVIYRDPANGKLLCRPPKEFGYGRFVTAAAPASDGGRA